MFALLTCSVRRFAPKIPSDLRVYRHKQIAFGKIAVRTDNASRLEFFGYHGRLRYKAVGGEYLVTMFKRCLLKFWQTAGMEARSATPRNIHVPRMGLTILSLSDSAIRFNVTLTIRNRAVFSKTAVVRGKPKYELWSFAVFKQNVYRMFTQMFVLIFRNPEFKSTVAGAGIIMRPR